MDFMLSNGLQLSSLEKYSYRYMVHTGLLVAKVCVFVLRTVLHIKYNMELNDECTHTYCTYSAVSTKSNGMFVL